MPKQTAKKPVRTKSASVRRKSAQVVSDSYDGVFALKLALYLVLGTMWIKVTDGHVVTVPIPIGLILGMILTSHEHFKLDRKIEYAVLMVAALIGFFAPFGLYVAL